MCTIKTNKSAEDIIQHIRHNLNEQEYFDMETEMETGTETKAETERENKTET